LVCSGVCGAMFRPHPGAFNPRISLSPSYHVGADAEGVLPDELEHVAVFPPLRVRRLQHQPQQLLPHRLGREPVGRVGGFGAPQPPGRPLPVSGRRKQSEASNPNVFTQSDPSTVRCTAHMCARWRKWATNSQGGSMSQRIAVLVDHGTSARKKKTST